MTMNKVFNSNFEISLRILLTLSISTNTGKTIDSIATADFITIYAKEFELSASNLHGDNELSFSEFSARRLSVNEAIKSLVLEHLVNVSQEQDGFHYSISERGINFCNTLNSDYAKEYKSYAIIANEYMKSKTEKQLLNLISKEAVKSLRKE